MLASPHASTSQATYSLSPIRAASHSSASSTRSSTTSLSSRDAADAHPLAESLLREEDEGEQGSPATSEGGAGSSTHLVSSPNGTTAMDVCEEEGEEEGGQHIKLSRRMSSESAGSAGRPAHRHPNDPSRPPNRKAQRLDTTAEADITACPPAELLSLLASVLSHIARANDARRGSMQPPAMCCSGWSRGMDEAAETKKRSVDTMTLAARTAHSSSLSTLCFHARNVPSIAIEAYLLRILKYCPTTNEVFIALLVYFDRMARFVPSAPSSPAGNLDLHGAPQGFAVDSFNVHRLLIAGVTVASKFFSDVFYTNSRYAKVGGLPLNELNQLELQFLLLNDFQLTISLDELQRYADYLLLRWRPPPMPTLRHSDSEASSSAETATAGESEDTVMSA